jgi:SseB protein N-terminal domain
MTDLENAHAAMLAAPADDALRLRYYAVLADAEMILLLQREVVGTDIAPRVFDLADGPVVLIFDGEEKLADLVGAAPYVALPGRVIAGVLAGQGVGLGVNLGTASEMLLDADAVAWLAQTLQAAPVPTQAAVAAFHAPVVPDVLISALMTKLRGGVGQGLLAGVTYRDGRRGHVLALLDAGNEAALAQGASEALVFSGIEAGEMDVMFLRCDDPVVAAMARVARVLDLAEVAAPPVAPKAPGMDPDKPPRLR